MPARHRADDPANARCSEDAGGNPAVRRLNRLSDNIVHAGTLSAGLADRTWIGGGHCVDVHDSVLVRPDMHIAWRANGMADDPAAEPLEMMGRILPLPI